MLEQKHEKLVPVNVFVRRMVVYVLCVILLFLSFLFIGMAGYHWIVGLSWVDSLLNASMILGGMGEIDPLVTTNAKIFASVYALFSGVVFIASMGIFFTPIMHRILHSFHVEDKDFNR